MKLHGFFFLRPPIEVFSTHQQNALTKKKSNCQTAIHDTRDAMIQLCTLSVLSYSIASCNMYRLTQLVALVKTTVGNTISAMIQLFKSFKPKPFSDGKIMCCKRNEKQFPFEMLKTF